MTDKKDPVEAAAEEYASVPGRNWMSESRAFKAGVAWARANPVVSEPYGSIQIDLKQPNSLWALIFKENGKRRVAFSLDGPRTASYVQYIPVNQIAGRASLESELHLAKQDRDSWKQTFITSRDAASAHIGKLEAQVKGLAEALNQVDCKCSIAERDSGHLVGCYMPAIIDAIARFREGGGA